MRQKIILISGFGGSGKSTSGESLQEKLSSCARIEADDLILIKPFIIGNQLGRIKLKNVIDVTTNFLAEKFENIIIIGCVWTQEELDEIIKFFDPIEYDIYMFWLHASKEVRFDRVTKRAESGDTLAFLEQVEKSIEYPKLPFKLDGGKFFKIDVDNKAPEEVLTELFNQL